MGLVRGRALAGRPGDVGSSPATSPSPILFYDLQELLLDFIEIHVRNVNFLSIGDAFKLLRDSGIDTDEVAEILNDGDDLIYISRDSRKILTNNGHLRRWYKRLGNIRTKYQDEEDLGDSEII